MKKITIITTIACLFLITGLLSTSVQAATATPTPKSANSLPDRLFKAKTVAKKHVLRRETEIKRLKQMLNRKSATMLKADLTSLETSVAEMENKLKSWRQEIDKSTTVDQLKELHKKWFMETRVFAVFAPKIAHTVRTSIVEKNTARAKKRAGAQSEVLAKKRNNEKNEKFEKAKSTLTEAGSKIADVESKTAELKTKIQAYKASDYNANPTDFHNKVKATSTELSQTAKKLGNAFNVLKEVGEKLKDIAKGTPTPTPLP